MSSVRKIYTKKGDTGSTSLSLGLRLRKWDSRLQLLGEIDQLIVNIGQLRVHLLDSSMSNSLKLIQETLMGFNALVAGYNKSTVSFDVKILEDEMDNRSSHLPCLKNFIIPGHNVTEIAAHQCRVQTRKVERIFVKLLDKSLYSLTGSELIWINRLSDYFFMLARWIVYNEKGKDDIWNNK